MSDAWQSYSSMEITGITMNKAKAERAYKRLCKKYKLGDYGNGSDEYVAILSYIENNSIGFDDVLQEMTKIKSSNGN